MVYLLGGRGIGLTLQDGTMELTSQSTYKPIFLGASFDVLSATAEDGMIESSLTKPIDILPTRLLGQESHSILPV